MQKARNHKAKAAMQVTWNCIDGVFCWSIAYGLIHRGPLPCSLSREHSFKLVIYALFCMPHNPLSWKRMVFKANSYLLRLPTASIY